MGVTTATLYSYVSRGRIGRTLGSDGRSSLFDLAEVDALIAASSRPVPPPPTIDVRISTDVTQLDESGLRYRGTLVDDLVDEPFERVCALLWTGSLGEPSDAPHLDAPHLDARPARADSDPISTMSITRDATEIDPGLDAVETATRLIGSTAAVGSLEAPDASFAERLILNWVDDPSPQLVRAVNSALVLLADHGLATSTFAVRVATSVRASAVASMIAGLATMQGALHGSASAHTHQLFTDVAARGAVPVITEMRCAKQRVPGFGHKIYRDRDPRFELLLDRVRLIPGTSERMAVVDETIDAVRPVVARLPNIDLALGALSYATGLPADIPLFAVARIAGWTAHHLEELEERPVRYRGLAN